MVLMMKVYIILATVFAAFTMVFVLTSCLDSDIIDQQHKNDNVSVILASNIPSADTTKITPPTDTTLALIEKISSDHYQVALDETTQMLDGKKPLSSKRAVFLTESVYY
jgi:sensor domain CHASE-containing protein